MHGGSPGLASASSTQSVSAPHVLQVTTDVRRASATARYLQQEPVGGLLLALQDRNTVIGAVVTCLEEACLLRGLVGEKREVLPRLLAQPRWRSGAGRRGSVAGHSPPRLSEQS